MHIGGDVRAVDGGAGSLTVTASWAGTAPGRRLGAVSGPDQRVTGGMQIILSAKPREACWARERASAVRKAGLKSVTASGGALS